MEGVPGPDAEVGDQPFSAHVNDEAPSVQKLVNGFSIPPVEIEHPVGNLGDFSQGCDHIVHHHVVQYHVYIKRQGD